MTYASSGLIQSADYNGLVSTNTPNVNAIWSTGSGNSGYGQPVLPTVAADSIVFSSSWSNLITAITRSAAHQGTSIGAFLNGTPDPGELIQFESNMLGNINSINTNRLNAISQGGTTSTVATSTSSWSNLLTITFQITFSSGNNARYFFNAGGQFGLNFSHPTGAGINATISSLCAAVGTVWLSSPTSGTAVLSGTPYNGVTKIGGSNPGATTISTNTGFYALTTIPAQLFNQTATGGYYYAGSYLRIYAAYNTSGVLTLTAVVDDVGGGYYYGGTVSAGTTATLIKRPPSTTYLNNSWGTPGVTSTIVAT